MSYGQKALYFLYLNSPESASYNVAFTARLLTVPDVNLLKKSFQKLINNNESLRSTFFIKDGDPVQEIHGYTEVFFEEIDLQGLSEEEIKIKITEIYKTPFDLESGPVFKVHLFKAAEENFILLINMHHICSDGWSIGIMLSELKTLYEDEIKGNEPASVPERSKYSDYVESQKKLIDSDEGEKLWDYWKSELSGDIPVLDLSTDKPRPAVQSFNGSTEYFFPEKDVAEKLKKLSQNEGTTFFVTLLAAYQILLQKYSGQDEILTGTPTAGRNKTGFENIIGYFINPVVIRGNFDKDLTFKEFLFQIKKKVIGAVSNQDFPFPLVVERLLKKRDPGRSPIFQTFFGLQKVPKGNEIQELVVPGNDNAKVSFGSLELQSYNIPQQEGQFDLMLEFFEGESLFAGVIKYNTDIFSPERIKRMSDHFKTLLNSILDDPGRKISELEILSIEETEKIIYEWNDTAVDYDLSPSIESIFCEQAKQTPNAVAVEYEDKQLTYKELDDITNQLGNLLIRAGVKKDSLVGVYLERSPEMIIALMGILKAGGAYVPIDPSYPKERVDYMIEDSGVEIILTQNNLSGDLQVNRKKIIILDSHASKISDESSKHPAIESDPNSLAYMIYTSGSTGKPKGAMNTNKGIINRLLWMTDYLNIHPSDKIFQKTSFSFDVSVWEFFLPLITGATLVFAKPEGHKDTKYLIKEIIEKEITHMHFVPSMLQVFLEDDEISNCKSLKKVVCSGEEMTVSLQDLFFDKISNCELYNLYGPTEAAVDVTYWKCEDESKLNVVPIGRPVANTQIYILNSDLKPVPIGIPGELHIGGVQVARGYQNREELTSEKFIPDPFSKKENSKLYKTGDLVRYLNDGNIEYLGRIDNQIKIRGFRIELGEIEFVMNQYQDVREAIVISKEIKKGDKRLIAFIVSKKENPVDLDNLRNYLKEKLPDYMIPSQIILLDEIPLSHNGKADRKALGNYEFSRDELTTEFASASKPVEEILVNIWKEILSVDKIGINDNFFELGGDSILSIQIISKANQHGLKITPKQIFQYQTIGELSSVIEYKSSGDAVQNPVEGEVYLTPVQKWFFEMQLTEPDHFNHSVLLKIPSGLDTSKLEKAVGHVTKHHDALRLRFREENSEWSQTNSVSENSLIFDIEDLSSKNDFNQIMSDSINKLQTSLNLESGPIIKVRLFRTGSNEDRLLIIIHHLAVDGISWRIILEDIYKSYQQLNEGSDVVLPSKTTSYKDWSAKLSEYSQSDKISAETDYWLKVTEEKVKEIPKDIATDTKTNTVESIDVIKLNLNQENTKSLLTEVPKVYNTKINDILLTGLLMAYQNWSNESKILLDLEGHGREDIFDNTDLSRTAGWFTTVYPVLLKTDNINDIGNTIKNVKEYLRQIPNNGIGYGILKYLANQKTLKNLSNAEIIFNYLGQLNDEIIPGADWTFGNDAIVLSQNKYGVRSHLIEINSIILNNELTTNFVFSRNIHSKETIDQLKKYYEEALINIIEHCKSPDAGGYTPSDFEAAGLDQQELDNLLANLN